MIKNQSIYKSEKGREEIMALYDSVLNLWPVPHEELYVETRLGKTFVIAGGPKEAPPLVLLHGASSNAVSWIGDAPIYSEHFRTYAIDIPGDPGHSGETRPAWNGPAYADWLADVLNELGIEKTAVLGLSQGGWNAALFATHYPEKVSKLVLMTPAGFTQDNPLFLLRAVLSTMMGRKGAEALNRYVFGDDKMDDATLVFMNAILTHFKPRIERLKLFTDEYLQHLTMPVMLVGGAKDRIRNVSGIARRLQPLLPDLTIKVLPERGHVLVNTTSLVIPFLQNNK